MQTLNTRTLSGLLLAVYFLAHPAQESGQCSDPPVKLTVSDGAANDWFGSDVSLDGDVALVSARNTDPIATNSGAAYVYRHDGNGWAQVQKLVGSGTKAGDLFGYGVSVSGTLAVVGAIWGDGLLIVEGVAYVYRHDGSQWLEEQTLWACDGAIARSRCWDKPPTARQRFRTRRL